MALIDDVTFTEEDDLIEEAVDIRRRLKMNKISCRRGKKRTGSILPEVMKSSSSYQDSGLLLESLG